MKTYYVVEIPFVRFFTDSFERAIEEQQMIAEMTGKTPNISQIELGE